MEKTFSINHEAISCLHKKYEAAIKEDFSYSLDERPILGIEEFGCLIEHAFWASLIQEEGKFHNFSIRVEEPRIYLACIPAYSQYHFKEHLEVNKLAKLSPALENTGSFCVWCNKGDQPYIHGFRRIESSNFRITTVSAGELILYFAFPYPSTAILTGSKIESIEKVNVFSNFFGQNKSKSESLLKRIANSMRNHRHGGTLLIVNNGKEIDEMNEYELLILEKSLDNPYAPKTAYKALSCALERHNFSPENPEELSRTELEEILNSREYDMEVYVKEGIIKLLSQLTAIDGATIINTDFEILGFGAKIKPDVDKNPNNETIEVSEPFEESQWVSKDLSELGGTRHQSAARFVSDQQNNSFAVVASQDGKVSVMHWDKKTKMVRVIQHAEYLFV